MRALRIFMICLWSVIGLAILAALIYGMMYGTLPGQGSFGFTGVSFFGARNTADMELVVDKTFAAGDIDELKIDLLSDDCVVQTTSENNITVRQYVSNMPENRYIRAEKKGSTLEIGAQREFSLTFNFFTWRQSRVEITLPESYRKAIDAKISSGSITLVDGLTLEELALHTTSGDIRCEEPVNAESAKLSVTSGNIEMAGGLKTEDYSLKVTSGDISINEEFTGSGKIKVTSGNITLEGVEIDEDLSIDVTSGDVDLALVGEPGLEFTAKKLSGDISAYFDIDGDDWKTYSATVGEAPYKRLNVEVTSGNVRIKRA